MDEKKITDTETRIDEEDEHIRALQETLDKFQAKKPGDRSEKDRHFAIAITDLEKLIAYAAVYLVD